MVGHVTPSYPAMAPLGGFSHDRDLVLRGEDAGRTERLGERQRRETGLLHLELVTSATLQEKAGLDETPAQAYLSANRTCEMGLRQATGRPYESFVFLLEELTRPAPA